MSKFNDGYEISNCDQCQERGLCQQEEHVRQIGSLTDCSLTNWTQEHQIITDRYDDLMIILQDKIREVRQIAKNYQETAPIPPGHSYGYAQILDVIGGV